MSQIELIEKKIRELDTGSLIEVNHLIDYLLDKKKTDEKKDWVFSRQSWAGALKELRDQFTSVELQKKALDWWNEDVSR